MVGRRGSSLPWVAIGVLILVLGLVVFYYNFQLNQQAGASSSSIQNLQKEAAALQASNAELEKQLASGNNLSTTISLGADPVQVYNLSSRSVVTIQGVETVTTGGFFGPQTSESSVLGSGFVTTYLGSTYIVTNFHVVNGISNLTVTFSDGDAYLAKVVGTDAYSDLAVVSLNAPASEFAPLTVIPSVSVSVGQTVFAIGNPYGLSGSLTYGIVSQLGRTIQESTAGGFSIPGVIQFSAPINPGNSGGPLLDANGMVIGITTAIVGGSQGVGFAIPSSTILRELPSLVSTGKYQMHSFLGIGGTDMDYQLALASKTNVTYGVLIENVTSGSGAAKAGLRAGSSLAVVNGQQYAIGGDIIVSVNGTRIVSQDALATYLEQNTIAGQTIQLGIIRSGAPMTLSAVLGTRPPPPG